jgi:hypothetical protein
MKRTNNWTPARRVWFQHNEDFKRTKRQIRNEIKSATREKAIKENRQVSLGEVAKEKGYRDEDWN